MNGNEFITAVDRGLNLKVIVSNNGSYRTVRTHKQRHFPNRVSGTDLSNPNFSELARSFGARGFRITTANEVKNMVCEAMSAVGPVLIEICCDPDESIETSLSLG